MGAYLEQLERLKAWRPRLKSIAPGHGHLIDHPIAKIDEYLDHRHQREAQVLECVRSGTTKVAKVVEQLYPDLIDELVPMAEATVWAHLLKLKAEGTVSGKSQDGRWSVK
jgi:hydroxyacylglutathione hydrolase